MPDVKRELDEAFKRHDQGRSQSEFAKKKKPYPEEEMKKKPYPEEEKMKGNPCPEYPKEEKKKK